MFRCNIFIDARTIYVAVNLLEFARVVVKLLCIKCDDQLPNYTATGPNRGV